MVLRQNTAGSQKACILPTLCYVDETEGSRAQMLLPPHPGGEGTWPWGKAPSKSYPELLIAMGDRVTIANGWQGWAVTSSFERKSGKVHVLCFLPVKL